MIGPQFNDLNGHGTTMAAAVLAAAPDVELIAIRIMDESLRTSADLMAAGIETAFRNGARIINLSMGTPNMGKALLLRDTAALAAESGAVVLAAAHPRGERAYPGIFETLGILSHPECGSFVLLRRCALLGARVGSLVPWPTGTNPTRIRGCSPRVLLR